MMGTFAAVGATRMTRRNLAAAQAGSLGVVGALLGTLVGFVPGIALARATTGIASNEAGYLAEGQTPATVDPTVVIPWLQLAVPILLVPALAALLAWLAIRKAPTVTRRRSDVPGRAELLLRPPARGRARLRRFPDACTYTDPRSF